jgi:hypothetical protein
MTGIECVTSGATIRQPPFPGVAVCCRIGLDKPISLLKVACGFCVLRSGWCQRWCQTSMMLWSCVVLIKEYPSSTLPLF